MRFVLTLMVSLALGACGEDDTAPGSGGSGTGGSSGSTGGAGLRCSSEDDCSAATPHCDMATGTCTGCRSDDDCRGPLFCNAETGICRDCVSDAHCGGVRPICDAVSGQCTASCSSSADCTNTRGPTQCDTSPGRGVCVDCTGPNQPCPFCETVTFSCVGCLTDADCPATVPFCGPSKACSPSCSSDNDCPGALFCDPKTARCLECVTNANCPGEVCQTDYTCG